jgi:hypothetical protein
MLVEPFMIRDIRGILHSFLASSMQLFCTLFPPSYRVNNAKNIGNDLYIVYDNASQYCCKLSPRRELSYCISPSSGVEHQSKLLRYWTKHFSSFVHTTIPSLSVSFRSHVLTAIWCETKDWLVFTSSCEGSCYLQVYHVPTQTKYVPLKFLFDTLGTVVDLQDGQDGNSKNIIVQLYIGVPYKKQWYKLPLDTSVSLITNDEYAFKKYLIFENFREDMYHTHPIHQMIHVNDYLICKMISKIMIVKYTNGEIGKKYKVINYNILLRMTGYLNNKPSGLCSYSSDMKCIVKCFDGPEYQNSFFVLENNQVFLVKLTSFLTCDLN